MNPIWFVNEGPDTRHLINTHLFYRLREAQEFVASLDNNRAYQLIRWTEKTDQIIKDRIL